LRAKELTGESQSRERRVGKAKTQPKRRAKEIVEKKEEPSTQEGGGWGLIVINNYY